MRYSKERKEAVLKKMIPPHSRGVMGTPLKFQLYDVNFIF